MIQPILKNLFNKYIKTSYLERVYSQSIFKNRFKELANIKKFQKERIYGKKL